MIGSSQLRIHFQQNVVQRGWIYFPLESKALDALKIENELTNLEILYFSNINSHCVNIPHLNSADCLTLA